tara:strand:+ start:244 stop:429 length:186 start_codon:yes stop_codon:yes gene_type:complete
MKENAIIIACFLAVCVGWYYGYVKPADELRYAVMGCMADRGDSSRAGYDACVATLRPRGDK